MARVDWLTLDTIDGRDLTLPLPLSEKFNAIHCCLIPYGPHRGNVLVLDGNLRAFSIPNGTTQLLQRIRDKQPWAIVNPYWPAPHPYAGGQGHRFHNRVLPLPLDPGNGANLGELFCAGQTWMADGRLFLAGGTLRFPTTPLGGDFLGSKLTWFFDPASVAWIRGPDLAVRRWYPTVCHDGNDQPTGRALVLGGTDPGGAGVLDHFESFQVTYNATNPQALADSRTSTGVHTDMRLYAGLPGQHLNAPFPRDLSDYPRIHLLTDGRFFNSGFDAPGALFLHNVVADPTYSMNHGLMPATSADYQIHYPTCIYASNAGGVFDRILRIGGPRAHWTGTGTHHTESKLVEACDAKTAGSIWTTGGIPNMYWDRFHFNVVVLPGGELLAIGGLSVVSQNFVPNFQPELLVNNQFWTQVASQSHLRHYHSCALLLPDGRVFVGGGEGLAGWLGGARPVDYQIYNPPYITMGLARPNSVLVTTLGGTLISQDQHGALTYGGTYRVTWNPASLPTGVSVDRVVLTRPSALTHHDDGGQRHVVLASSSVNDTTVDVERQFTLPTNPYQLPRGWYMLWLVTNQSAPSTLAYWVNVR